MSYIKKRGLFASRPKYRGKVSGCVATCNKSSFQPSGVPGGLAQEVKGNLLGVGFFHTEEWY